MLSIAPSLEVPTESYVYIQILPWDGSYCVRNNYRAKVESLLLKYILEIVFLMCLPASTVWFCLIIPGDLLVFLPIKQMLFLTLKIFIFNWMVILSWTVPVEYFLTKLFTFSRSFKSSVLISISDLGHRHYPYNMLDNCRVNF